MRRIKFVLGKRTIKTTLAVFCCCMLYLLLKLLEKTSLFSDDFAYKWYNPFFASIATAYSIHKSKKESIIQAKRRSIASIIGGVIGIALVMIYEIWHKWPMLIGSPIHDLILPYILTSLAVIVVIFVSTTLGIPDTVFLGILTLTSVTINPSQAIQTNYGIWVFGINRIISTIIGVLIALAINCFRLPHPIKNKDIIFVVGIEGAILNGKNEFSGFFKYKLNDFEERGINLSLYTTRAPMTFMPLLEGIKLRDPVLCMSGAALYDTQKNKYVYTCPLRDEDSEELSKIFDEIGIIPFKNNIINDTLFITTKNKNHRFNNLYFDDRLDMGYCNILDRDLFQTDVLYYLILDTREMIDKIISRIGKDKYYYVINDCLDDFNKDNNLVYLKIYNKNVQLMYGIKEYAAKYNYRIASLTSLPVSDHLLDSSDIKATFISNAKEYDGHVDFVIKRETYNELFKTIDKIYFNRRYQIKK